MSRVDLRVSGAQVKERRMDLSGRSIIVTGASGNLGRAVSARLARDGARVVPFVHEKRSEAEREVELTDERSVEAAFAGIPALWAAVNCAGAWRGGLPVRDTPTEIFEAMVGMNLRSAFLVSRAALRQFGPEGGRIVNVSAAPVAALAGIGGSAAYAAAKAGVIALTKALAEEGAAVGVRANCVAPGTMRTPQNERAMPGVSTAGWVEVDAVAEAIAFLCDPRSSAVNGAVVALPSF
jgi:NAD(P)-dependent dehydrogenase (short-subunit alcohol dehydrogenase family)